MFTLTPTIFVVYYSPEELDGDYPPWVLWYMWFAVQAYQVGASMT